MKVIVNADDYGMNENTTKAILECFSYGLLTNTTMLVNMPFSNSAVDMARNAGIESSVGLHLNLVQGVPLSDRMRNNKTFCGNRGEFDEFFGLGFKRYQRFYLSEEDKECVAIELRAQMMKFKKYGFTELHCDAHRYTNCYLPILPIMLACAKEQGFRTTRGVVNTSNGRGENISCLRSLYIRHVYSKIRASGMLCADAVGFTWDIDRLVESLPESKLLEIHCHPNYRNSDDEVSLDGNLKDWTTPYKLSFSKIEEFKRMKKVQLVDFNALCYMRES